MIKQHLCIHCHYLMRHYGVSPMIEHLNQWVCMTEGCDRYGLICVEDATEQKIIEEEGEPDKEIYEEIKQQDDAHF